MAVAFSTPAFAVNYHGSLTDEHGVYWCLPCPSGSGRFNMYPYEMDSTKANVRPTERTTPYLRNVRGESFTEITPQQYSIRVFTDCVEVFVYGQKNVVFSPGCGNATADYGLHILWDARHVNDTQVRSFLHCMMDQFVRIENNGVQVCDYSAHDNDDADIPVAAV